MKQALLAALLLTAGAGFALAQSPSPAPVAASAAPLSRQEATAVLGALDAALDHYVFPEKAALAKAVLRRNHDRYAQTGDRAAFAAALTKDLAAALDDTHFYVRSRGASSAGPAGGRGAFGAETAYGVATVRRLPGNIGYVELPLLSPEEGAPARLNAAMDLVQDTEALIIDLRDCRGGGGAALDTLIGRLAAKPIARSALLWRRADGGFERMQPENAAYPAEKLYRKPVYLLTSKVTISAGEGFAYDVQQAGRALVVGETTSGGASPMNRPPFDLGAGFVAWVSNGTAEHPVTKTSPRGTGVKPDVVTSPEAALAEAYRRALAEVQVADAESRLGREVAAARADPDAALKKGAGTR
jgi:hypothetical protein